MLSKKHGGNLSYIEQFLSAFVDLRKTTISFFMSACLSVLMELLFSHWKDFHEMTNLSYLSKICGENRVLLNLTRMTDILHEDLSMLMISCSVIIKIRNVLDKVVETIRTHIFCPIPFPKTMPFLR
jgi:hypothetical protein